ncbi:MAG: hypothetical protein ACI4U0_00115 [Candidatus Aphodocola sp.]
MTFVSKFCYTNFVLWVVGDEIWNYGFSYNINAGLIPYRDFNMVVTPLYSFIGAIFLKIFGNYLFSLHILDAVLTGIMMCMLFKIIRWKSFLLYPFIVFYATPSYNFLCLFWLVLILYLLHFEKNIDIILGVIVGFLFLTKQTVGVCLAISIFYYSQNKIKFVLGFIIPLCIFGVYLVYYNAFYQFIDYCFLGMIDFNNSNKLFSIFTFLEICICIYLGYSFFKSNFQNKEIIYILMFQVLTYPIFDIYHFLVVISPVVYYYLKGKNNKFFLFFCALGVYLFFISCAINCCGNIMIGYKNNFTYLRNYNQIAPVELEKKAAVILNYDEVEYQFFITNQAYILKLFLDIPINQFDLMNSGNMGYHGEEVYIQKINNMCSHHSCIFFVDEMVFDEDYTQFNKEIYHYVINTYHLKDKNEYFMVYIN